ncbi:MAG TPA: GDSL-type esterase/lipase family protein, partial [Sediminibacterium sp.]
MKKAGILILMAVIMAAFKPPVHTRIFMIGDSTMADKPLNDNPERGWGQLFPQFFSDAVSVRNYAVNGRSTKSFIREGRWDSVMKQLRKDDWVIIQFGHNDEKKEDTNRYAAPQTAYRDNLARFIRDARSKGAHPILVTPVMRRKFDEKGKLADTHGEYPDVVRALSKEMDVPLIDLHRSSRVLVEQEGAEGSKKLFLWIDQGHYQAAMAGKKDDTHFSEYGASSIAGLVCREIQEKKIGLAAYLKPSAHPGKMAYELPRIYRPDFKKDTFDIRKYGAVANGLTLNTKAINNAIADCSKGGGGVVLIPEGLWLTGPILFQNNVELHALKGALVLFTPDHLQYPLVSSSFEGVAAARCQSPITAENLENIAITGKGIFHGSGDTWRPQQKAKMTDSEWRNKVASGGVLNKSKTTWYSSPGALKGSLTNNIGKLSPGLAL